MADNGQERTEDATPRRRQDARKKGTVARSVDLTNALVITALVIVLPSTLVSFGTGLMGGMKQGLATMPMDVSSGSLSRYSWGLLQPAIGALAPLVLTALVVGLASNFAQVGFVMSGESLTPSFQKINPLEGFKRLFSSRAVVEALKASIKALLFGYIAFSVVSSRWNDVIGLSWMTPSAAASTVGSILQTIFTRVAICWLVIASLDYLFQRKQTNKQLMMTKDELKREFKEQEGSPELKMAQAQRRRKLSKGRMMDRVKSADAIITNPTHFAVAVSYDRSKDAAPIVVAKGQDYLAQKIREVATSSRVPIVPNPPLARALYKQCEVGDFIPRHLFQAVAEVLAYVYRTVKGVRSNR